MAACSRSSNDSKLGGSSSEGLQRADTTLRRLVGKRCRSVRLIGTSMRYFPPLGGSLAHVPSDGPHTPVLQVRRKQLLNSPDILRVIKGQACADKLRAVRARDDRVPRTNFALSGRRGAGPNELGG